MADTASWSGEKDGTRLPRFGSTVIRLFCFGRIQIQSYFRGMNPVQAKIKLPDSETTKMLWDELDLPEPSEQRIRELVANEADISGEFLDDLMWSVLPPHVQEETGEKGLDIKWVMLMTKKPLPLLVSRPTRKPICPCCCWLARTPTSDRNLHMLRHSLPLNCLKLAPTFGSYKNCLGTKAARPHRFTPT